MPYIGDGARLVADIAAFLTGATAAKAA